SRPARRAGLVILVLGPLAWLLFGHGEPIPQDRGYHVFADGRSCLGIPNFGNISSNLLFLLVGVAGIRHCWRQRHGAWRSWRVCFAGVALVFFGSAWYHRAPNDHTLVWDRLPMTMAFMSLFAALVSEHLEARLEARLLASALAVGVFSVFWWQWSGDLRIYIWVQGAPLLAIPYLIVAFPGRYDRRPYRLFGVGLYALATCAELYDHEIYAATATAISGHSAKHLLAALAVFCVLRMLQTRQSLTPVASSQ
ncbi:MAG: ceramidase domain-containing protein, partial [Burkholderiales bacterium]|nr:ceramidase domain-containing protein [Burkholderiales bacterium]